MPKWPKRESFWVLLRREPVAIKTQSGRREAKLSRRPLDRESGVVAPHDRKAPITRKRLIEMLDKSLEKKNKPEGG
jgi:hypothetical protein